MGDISGNTYSPSNIFQPTIQLVERQGAYEIRNHDLARVETSVKRKLLKTFAASPGQSTLGDWVGAKNKPSSDPNFAALNIRPGPGVWGQFTAYLELNLKNNGIWKLTEGYAGNSFLSARDECIQHFSELESIPPSNFFVIFRETKNRQER